MWSRLRPPLFTPLLLSSPLNVAHQFERSTDTGQANEFGEAQKLMSTGRTSENAWCIGDCYAHPEVGWLLERKKEEEEEEEEEGLFVVPHCC